MSNTQKQQNKAGTWFALVTATDGETGLVHKLCSNYSLGQTNTKWRICNLPKQDNTSFQKMAREGMAISEAKALFTKKLKGSQK